MLIPTRGLLRDAKRIAAEFGYKDVKVSRDGNLWAATAKRQKWQLWLSVGGSTRRSAIAGLMKAIESEDEMNLDHAYTPCPALPRCECGSYAINDHPERTLCDRCWRDKEIEQLQAIVDQLPKDAEDNPVLLGHTILFHPDENTCGHAHEYGDCKVMFMDAYGNKTLRPVAECYNSYSSAQTARKQARNERLINLNSH